jgi:cytochrome c-type biogenesis protein CcmH/NrfF
MQKWTSRVVLAGLLSALGFAQTATELETPAVNRVAEKLNCPCGCKMNMACRMDPYPCGTCREAKIKILAMQTSGKSDEQILNQFAQENGKDMLVQPPGLMGVGGICLAAAIGLGIVLVVIRRLRRQPAAAAGPEIDAATLGRIDKELSRRDADEFD